MTFFHFVSTFLLSFVSPYVVYYSKQSSSATSSSGLKEKDERRFSNIVVGIVAYGLTLFCKMFLIAVVIQDGTNLQSGAINFDDTTTSSGMVESLSFSFLITEVLKTLIGALDMIGIYFLLSSRWLLGDQISQIYGCAIGWTMGDNLLNRLIPLWFSTRGLQFETKALQMAVYSNVVMLEWISVVIFVFLYSRKKYDQKTFAWNALAALSVVPLVVEILKILLGLNQCVWCLVGIKAVVYGVTLLIANSRYSQFEQQQK
ncbi:hypothetical protein FDP41_003382 [Naegleria fowleri]|uniref:BOS complex subunit TMEM147 n=1 Tax=Naegleria fowleri TaxID=5763 RepID=A0A6A5BUE8_NAEFO|nr:uncharacterized protein FDP41_003382 [Naegleria fowleri]KAF0977390.1 hypothetical protein FDP41_003382 [Naegleria fowleri]CAG4713905.1 unnamed protein product [Naegleria fowleri]